MTARPRSLGWLCAIALAALCVIPAAAQAALTIPPGAITLEVLNAAGESESRAGAHPDKLLLGFDFSDSGETTEEAKDLEVEFPAGLGGDPNAVPLCPRSQINVFQGTCPPESQVGRMFRESESLPLYSVEPGPNQLAVFAAITEIKPVPLVGHLRPGDLGLSLSADNLEQGPLGLTEGKIELWGVPADHQQGTSIPRRALLTTPTRCDGPLSVGVGVRTWQHPEQLVSGGGDTGHPLVGCDQLPFEPQLGFALEHPSADASSGASIDLTMPQSSDPDSRASAQIKDIGILFPPGMTVSLGGAAGLRACGDAQFGLGEAGDPTCPDASRVGTIELTIAGSSKPMAGRIYLGQEHPGNRFRLLIAASGSGSTVKFAASLHADPASGRLSADLGGLPQASFSRMSLRFDGGPGALLATPLSCGPATTTATFTPYSGTPPVRRLDTVSIAGPGGGACGGQPQFAPAFTGGSTSDRAGRATSFTATVRRQDGEQLPSQLEVPLPAGMSAALGTVDTCSNAAAAAAACPSTSRIGAAVAELGPGSEPAQVQGGIYLTGPYRRAPFGLALLFKATIGPFDLGSIVVRGALKVDPLSGRVTVVTDSLPQLVEGIPVRFATIGLDLDRPGFIHNPTSCAPTRMLATLRSQEGALFRASTPFAVRRCIDLPFRPAFSLALGGRSQLRREGRPSLRIAARVPANGANLRAADISLPGLLDFDAAGLREICARGVAMDGDCAKGARLGSASAHTPLLKKPMTGSIYAVQPPGDGSPELWIVLHGGGLEVSLKARTAVRKGHPETKLVGLPDFPLSSFSMALAGGKNGLLKLSRNPCGQRLFATTATVGQNGARASKPIPVKAPDCGGDG
jgi:hypothetical protein